MLKVHLFEKSGAGHGDGYLGNETEEFNDKRMSMNLELEDRSYLRAAHMPFGLAR